VSIKQRRGPLLGLNQHRDDERVHVTGLQRAAGRVGGKNSQPSFPFST